MKEIWVGAGVYNEAPYALVDTVKLYGGFSGSETERTQRDFRAHVTTLSGQSDWSSNAVIVVDAGATGSFTVLDGFTVTAARTASTDYTGGIVCQGCDTRIANCVVTANHAQVGGGMYIASGSPWIIDTEFIGNTATHEGGGVGGGVDVSGGTPTFINCTFIGNKSDSDGGGIYTDGQDVTLRNCTFTGNDPDGLRDIGTDTLVRNSVFWSNLNSISAPANMSVEYSCIEGGWTGEGNISDDPIFARIPDDGDDGWGDDPGTLAVDEGANDDRGDLRLTPSSTLLLHKVHRSECRFS